MPHSLPIVPPVVARFLHRVRRRFPSRLVSPLLGAVVSALLVAPGGADAQEAGAEITPDLLSDL
ncbi:MAG: hypothetical protein Q8W44_13480, partial [Candidatus Palauibacterales bacterium]|nr:hypothetical protein [Candidatus Palauibacterales bacterium]